jgi:hypothetical protein
VVVRSTFPPEATWLTDRELETVTAAEAIVGIETNNPETRAKIATEDRVEEGNNLLIRMKKLFHWARGVNPDCSLKRHIFDWIFVFTNSRMLALST